MNSRHFSQSIRRMAVVAATLALTGIMFASSPQEKLLYSFQGPSAPNGQDGEGPNDLISDKDGNLYGVTVGGGICLLPHYESYPCGIVFELSPPASTGGAWTEAVLYEFGSNLSDGSNPVGNLVRDKLGNLYGVTFYSSSSGNGGIGCGDFYELSPPSQQGGAWTETILYSFQGYVYNDGCEPMGRLVSDAKGNIYGPTALGGALASSMAPKGYSTGGIFKMSPPATAGGAWTEAFTQNLGGGIYPEGGLTIDRKGILYGTAGSYGTTSPPTIFQLIPPATAGGTWTGTTIYTFQSSDGTPSGGLIHDAKGNIFGTTQNGGAAGLGSAFELSPSQNGSSWTETNLYSFQGGSDGQAPLARMTLDKAGNLYGTTVGGGSTSIYCSFWQGCGTVFKLTHGANGWREQVIFRFQGAPTDGFYPSAALLLSGKTIYGATSEGGTVSQYVYGTVFEIN
jgi:hypothetical protein